MKTRFIFLLAVMFAGSTAYAQTGELITEVNNFDSRVSKLEGAYLKPAVIASKYKLEARLNDARVAHYLKDYQRASVLFVDLVRNERFRNTSSYREALWLLGDSLYELRNFLAAKTYLEQLLNLGGGEYVTESGGRLLEIAYRTGNFQDVDKVYAQLQSGQMGPPLYYLSGKAFYEKKDYGKARENFSRAAAAPEYKVVAEYYRGVTFAAEKNFAEARRVFEAVVKETPATERDLEVNDLAYIALGRVAYEQGDIEFAIDYYGRIPRTSKHFDRALWEQTWALVSKDSFESARQNVDVLLLLEEPDPSLIADAQLLRADLSLKLKEYNEARANYEEVVNKFSPVADEMNEFAAKQQDLSTFFGALVRDEVAGVEPEYLPPLVAEWARTDRDMRAATRALQDIRDIDSDIRDTFRLLDEVSARLNSSTRIMSFPELSEGLTQGVDAENRLIEIRRALVNAKHSRVSGSVNQSQWQQIAANLDAAEKAFKDMPSSRSDMVKRDAEVMNEFDRLRRRVDRIGYQLENQKAQLQAVDSYLNNNFGRPLSDKEKQRINELRQEIRSNINELATFKKDIESEIAIARGQVGAGDAVMLAEAKLREQYRAELQKASDFLSGYSGDSEASRIQNTLGKIPNLEARLKRYYNQLDQFVEEKVVELRRDLQAERELVTAHRDSIQQLITTADGGAGVLAYLNFMRARSQFNELILRGDVGVIDVVWRKKEDMSNRIGQMFEDRSSELRMLQESFDEVR